jgi:hypothetical protein
VEFGSNGKTLRQYISKTLSSENKIKQLAPPPTAALAARRAARVSFSLYVF